MKIKRFKLKDNIAKDDLIALKFRNGGSWVKKDAELFLSRCFECGKYNFEYSINIAFSSDILSLNLIALSKSSDLTQLFIRDFKFSISFSISFLEIFLLSFEDKELSSFEEISNIAGISLTIVFGVIPCFSLYSC
jgi:hypothetical protein